MKIFRWARFLIGFEISKPKTTWWDNSDNYRIRHEYLFSFSRQFFRRKKIYVYSIHIGRLAILMSKIKKKI